MAQQQASALYRHAPLNVRWPTGVELNIAFCLVRSGDVTEGITHARMAVTQLPATHQTRDMFMHARDVLNAIPRADASRPAVSEYRDWLDSSSNTDAAGLPALKRTNSAPPCTRDYSVIRSGEAPGPFSPCS
jgi:hypothetical protein